MTWWRKHKPPQVGEPLARVQCTLQPADTLLVHTATQGTNAFVVVRATTGATPDAGVVVALDAPHARAFAAGILNAADELDGTTALTFLPACEHNEKGRGR